MDDGQIMTVLLLIALLGIGVLVWRCWVWKQRYDLCRSEQEQLTVQIEASNESFMEVRGQRHDMMMHISAIQYMLESGQVQEAEQYMRDLAQQYERTNRIIKGEQGHMAALLQVMTYEAERAGIEVRYDPEAPLSALPLTALEQMRLAGNLLHNALEAARSAVVQAQKTPLAVAAYIQLHTEVVGGHYVLELRNTSAPIPGAMLENMYRRPVNSTKGEGHQGIGTYLVGSLVRRRHGSLDYRWLSGEFRVKIKLPIIVTQ